MRIGNAVVVTAAGVRTVDCGVGLQVKSFVGRAEVLPCVSTITVAISFNNACASERMLA